MALILKRLIGPAADPELKSYVSQPEVIDAFTHMVLEAGNKPCAPPSKEVMAALMRTIPHFFAE